MNNSPLRFPNQETSIDRIRAHMFHGMSISEKEMEILDRYNFIDNQINQGLTDKEIVSAAVKRYGTSSAQWYWQQHDYSLPGGLVSAAHIIRFHPLAESDFAGHGDEICCRTLAA